MTALSVQPPFPILTDIDGQPLEDGYVWIGVANLAPITNPITVYWDAAFTIPASQPIRTRGGFSVNSGTPANLYVNSDYSIQVQDKNGSVIYTSLNQPGSPTFMIELASTAVGKGASLVGINDAGNYYTSTTVEGALQEVGIVALPTPAARVVPPPNAITYTPARILGYDEEIEDGVDIRRLVGTSQTADQRATLQANLDSILSTVALTQRTKPVVFKAKGNGQRITLSGDINISQWYVQIEGAGIEFFFQDGGLKLTRTNPNFTLSNKLNNIWITGSGKTTHTGILLDLVSAPKTVITGGTLINGQHGLGIRGTVGSNITLDRIENIGLWGIREEPLEVFVTVSGTITATTGSTAVVGVGTSFTTQLAAGYNLFNGAGVYLGRIASVTDNLNLVLAANSTTAVTGGSYQAALIAESQGNTISCGATQYCGVKTGASSTWTGGAFRQIAGVGTKVIAPFDMESNARGIVAVNVALAEYSNGYAEVNGDYGDIWIGESSDASIPTTLTSAEPRLIPTGRDSEANGVFGFKTGGQPDPGAVTSLVVGTTVDLVAGGNFFSAPIEFKEAATNATIYPNPRLVGGVVNTGGARVARLDVSQTGWIAATGTADKGTFDTATVTLPDLAEQVKAIKDLLLIMGSARS